MEIRLEELQRNIRQYAEELKECQKTYNIKEGRMGKFLDKILDAESWTQ